MVNVVRPFRSVLHKTPDDYAMTGWEDIYFPADDGVPLEGWYIPAKGGESDKLVILTMRCRCAVQVFRGTLANHGALMTQ